MGKILLAGAPSISSVKVAHTVGWHRPRGGGGRGELTDGTEEQVSLPPPYAPGLAAALVPHENSIHTERARAVRRTRRRD